MHPDDELRKRLRERFASYEPEPETSWQEFETRLEASPKPVGRKRRVVLAILVIVLIIGGIGLRISRQSQLRHTKPARIAKVIAAEPHFKSVDKPQKASQPVARISKGSQMPVSKNSGHFESIISKPLLAGGHSSNEQGAGGGLHPNAREGRTRMFAEQHSLLPSNSLDNQIAPIGMLSARPAVDLIIGIYPPHIPASLNNKAFSPNKMTRPQAAWVIQGGALLGYSAMNATVRENNSALRLENLRTLLPERLGWHLSIVRQLPLSRGRQLEIGAVVRQFAQGIRYEIPNGSYSAEVQSDRSVIVTQLRDTLSDQFVNRQAGLRLGLKTPVLPAAGLYGGIGGEGVYRLNSRDIAVNAEVLIGKKLTRKDSKAVTIELFVNAATRSVYDSHGWVRVLPYHVGLRVGVPLGATR